MHRDRKKPAESFTAAGRLSSLPAKVSRVPARRYLGRVSRLVINYAIDGRRASDPCVARAPAISGDAVRPAKHVSAGSVSALPFGGVPEVRREPSGSPPGRMYSKRFRSDRVRLFWVSKVRCESVISTRILPTRLEFPRPPPRRPTWLKFGKNYNFSYQTPPKLRVDSKKCLGIVKTRRYRDTKALAANRNSAINTRQGRRRAVYRHYGVNSLPVLTFSSWQLDIYWLNGFRWRSWVF